ncbi:TPA: radical SAM protein, partial [Candidatus Micrarchaeota archaeon]|nr:radical SAM protein [Candidatus Micrarchaeota archaeon]
MAKQAVMFKRNPSSDSNIGISFTQPSQERNRGMPIAIIRGCPHNKCRFCGFYKTPDGTKRQKFSIRPLAEVKRDILAGKELARGILGIHSQDGRIRSVFLGDGDALAVSTGYLTELLLFMRANLPDLTSVKAYARVRAILNKRAALNRLREAGLTDVYVGFESGSDEILAM